MLTSRNPRATCSLRPFRFLSLAAVISLILLIAACGGGGGGNNNSASSSGSPSPTQQPVAANAANTVSVTVDRGLTGTRPNLPTVSVTICVAGTSTCQTVDHVQVDTASFGLRLLASALTPVLGSLPAATASNGGTLAECAAFADGFTWGTVRRADVKLGGETASNIPIQVIGDLSSNTVPQACAGFGVAQDTVQQLGTNGVLGIGVAPYDSISDYYSCLGNTNCSATSVTQSQLVANPVAKFATDNNGVILEMAPVSDSGAPSATGTLVFGIGTQSNNALSATQRFATDSFGRLSATLNGRTLDAFLDSGSNALFFADSSLPQCGGSLATFYCPSSTQSFTATLIPYGGGASGTAVFNVANAKALLGSASNYAANNLGGQLGSSASLDLGLSFFYGRYVYYGMDLTGSSGKTPYVAF
ncbi:DUF3443 domain-containing protein [Paraburkholderia mimosarum]|uniref:DUF3443 domain-containing protein n=1 Tax=Paraburkholderia mimosarum TaxID=312026 RepID=UPI0039C0CBC9